MRPHKPLSDILNRTTTVRAPIEQTAPAKVETMPKPKAKVTARPATKAKGKVPDTTRDDKRRTAGWRQFNILMPSDLLRDAKIKALRLDRPLSDLVVELVQRWTAH